MNSVLAEVKSYAQFARAWLADPSSVGAIAPSGRSLAGLITRGVDPSAGLVVELGAGTGVFTRALLKRGVREMDLIIVERNESMAQALRMAFPAALVLRDTRVIAHVAPPESIGAVISGLPLLNMGPATVQGIFDAVFARVRPSARLFQFTYGCNCPVPQEVMTRLALRADYIGGTIRNIPPAGVYQISRTISAGGVGKLVEEALN